MLFRSQYGSIPKQQRYLSASSITVARWREKLGAGVRPRVGIVWSGAAGHANDRNRSLALKDLLPHLPDGAEYFSLQDNVRSTDDEALRNSGLQDFRGDLVDFEETAGLVDLMDLVISVDTSVAHLAGALGKPTWVLLPYLPDWRWQLDGERSPWYPSMTLLRQGGDRQWKAVYDALQARLKHWISNAKNGARPS